MALGPHPGQMVGLSVKIPLGVRKQNGAPVQGYPLTEELKPGFSLQLLFCLGSPAAPGLVLRL